MIPRYTRPEMGKIWSTENKYQTWFQVENAVCQAMAEQGMIPQSDAHAIDKIGKKSMSEFDASALDAIAAIEAETHHDVIAFLTWLEQKIGDSGRFLHWGMTSSDLLDTALGLQIQSSAVILKTDLDHMLEHLKTLSYKYQYTPCMGRTHGVHAEPTTFGLKMAGYFAEFSRHRDRLDHAQETMRVAAISGAVGTYANLDPTIEARVAEQLGFKVETHSTQIIPRDRHAEWVLTLAMIGSSLDRLATEIRLLQRTETAELGEPFSKKQKGSSAMPHKRNPIQCENITGLARLLRSYAQPALENVVLWHERDISHSSVERTIIPDSAIVLDFALSRMNRILGDLQVNAEQMQHNLGWTHGAIYSQGILLALTRKGLSRDNAYRLVQKCAFEAYENHTPFAELLKQDPNISIHLSATDIDQLCSPIHAQKHVDVIFTRVFGARVFE